MIQSIITLSVKNKLIVFLAICSLVIWGFYSLSVIPIGAVPDVTNNQVQILTTTRNLATEEVEKFITYPVELEMSNLPGVLEIRSISKFGLSVVTVVFEESLGTYLPRQLIAEKLKAAAENIPAQFGTPTMGPITTGLGEIYQYTLEVDPAFRDRYSTTDLRTIQDWVVKRQLSGISGVVEVNTWGGFLKQYEIALHPQQMMELDVSVTEVFKAVEMNNDVTGGGYIEKFEDTYFIRADGLAKSLEEIGQFVVRNTGGVPVLIRDVATVQFGNATRFGAITGNGEGEKVMGQVMMLKDANSNEVIENVKQRVLEIQKTLPEGILINPFLERTELIDKTTATVEENLLLGALIVIFVIVLLLGNLRSGLIVASVIPLSLLFGISMMNLFGLSANLMSLGAIDFGIMVDGAVIIVEFILFQFALRKSKYPDEMELDQATRDEITIDSANKVMQPAIFGQIIILIVFIPILALTGIEGKMFKPMALSFSFTLIGAMILSLTYVPMVSALFTRSASKENFFQRLSSKLMGWIISIYEPTLEFALKKFRAVLVIAVILLAGSVFVFTRMGGEFIPTLDEGDFVVQPILKTGTSLSKTIEIMTDLERILIDKFPEVDQVVTRIGAAEVPTDPMSLEEADVIVKLKPRSEWVSADSKEELAEKMKEAMSVIPGIDFEFTQPIEMRFNELITGVRSDVAIKIYGENLDTLQRYAAKVHSMITNVPGASDVVVEKTDNLPQINVTYDRARLAQLGLNTADLNQVLQMAFGGATVSSIYEGEKRFDMVVRFHADHRQNIDDMRNIYIDLPDGSRLPLREVANINYHSGPAKISRDNTKRRIVIGINVRDRDVESMVKEIQGILGKDLNLPDGYYLTYGGQFENLQHAIDRLKIAVPAALILILIMLHFAFGSLRQALMVYSAIPLAAIGGIVALYVRGLPFSISAGVGFIALFGIAVLNGIVLIEFFNHLKKDGMTDILERIRQGTNQRLRPVLLTAGAAALGFLPMALSTSAGAEVQRPLATVVIGGLVTSTFLTLIVLPILYRLFGDPEVSSKRKNNPPRVALGLIFLLFGLVGFSQSNQPMTLEEAIRIAEEKNTTLGAYKLDVARSQALKKTAIDLGKTDLFYSFDQNNIAANGYALRVYGLSQSLPFPTVMGSESRLADKRTDASQANYELEKTRVKRRVSKAFYDLQFLQAKYIILSELDSVFQESLKATNRRYELGEVDQLELMNAKAHAIKLGQMRSNIQAEINNGMMTFRMLLQTDDPIELQHIRLTKLSIEINEVNTAIETNAGQLQQASVLEMKKSEMLLEKNKWLPDINLQYFKGFGMNENAQNYTGYQLGISLPLIFNAQRGRSQAKSIEYDMQENLMSAYMVQLETLYYQRATDLQNCSEKLTYFETEGLEMADKMLQMAHRKYTSGETGYNDFIRSLENAQSIKTSYLDLLNQYNQLVLDINFLTID